MSGKRENQERMARRALTNISVKVRLAALFLFGCTTAATVFIFTVGGSELADILYKKDVVYYDWKTIPLFFWLPAFFYADILIVAMMFFPVTRNLLEYLLTGMKAVAVYGWLMLFLSIPLSLIILFYSLSNYQSCGQKGPFSGSYYVKEIKMCEQFEYHPEKDKSEDEKTGRHHDKFHQAEAGRASAGRFLLFAHDSCFPNLWRQECLS